MTGHPQGTGHILWVGGAPDSGKTSITRALTERFHLQAYHYDLFDRIQPPGHWSRIDPARTPYMHSSPVHDRDWMWVDTDADDLFRRWLQTTPERFHLSLEDLSALSSHTPVIAEGYGFLPDLVYPFLHSPQQAIWLIPTEMFKRDSYRRRDKGSFADTRDPERARRNHIGRDLLIARYLAERADALGLRVVEVDGTRSLDQMIDLVASHFASFLPPSP